MSEKGKFIVFEGIGGCGKGTQAEKLRQVLAERGRSVLLTCEHTRDTPTGQLIEEIIKKRAPSIEADALQMLFVADRINHTQRVILPALDEGKIVIGDRYRGSTIAYAREEKRDYYDEIQKRVTLAPDLVIVLDLDPAEAVRRVNGRGDADIFDQVEKMKKCRESYDWYATESGDKCVWVEAGGSVEEVSRRVLKEVEKVI